MKSNAVVECEMLDSSFVATVLEAAERDGFIHNEQVLRFKLGGVLYLQYDLGTTGVYS